MAELIKFARSNFTLTVFVSGLIALPWFKCAIDASCAVSGVASREDHG